MKARIEKKLSKRLTEIAPLIFNGWWVDEDASMLACRQRSSVSHVPSEGYYDCSPLWDRWRSDWGWYFEGASGIRPTTRNLLRLAAEANAKVAALAERKRLLAGGE